MFPEGDMVRGGISWKIPDVNASGAHWQSDGLQSTIRHLQTSSAPKKQGCLYSPGFGGGYSLGTWYPLAALECHA